MLEIAGRHKKKYSQTLLFFLTHFHLHLKFEIFKMLIKTSVEDVGFFEGTEKLLEIWFEGDTDNERCDLRKIPREMLDRLLKIVDAEIVSVDKNEFIDSYVLSESSMFISKNRFNIKTCGITKLLYAVNPILSLAKKYAGMHVVNFFFSRRVYLRPEEQRGIHKSFQDEAEYLTEIIPNGTAYILGQNKKEQWYLFTNDNSATFSESDDVTLEILMEDLDQEAMAQFTKKKNKSSEEVIKNSGIVRIVPGSVNDGLLFDPIGYSLNGLFRDSYYTIHVTPQDSCSYVSFETNIKYRNYSNLIDRVLSVFRPGSLIITLFSNKGALCGDASHQLNSLSLKGYTCEDCHDQTLKNYTLAYRHYARQQQK